MPKRKAQDEDTTPADEGKVTIRPRVPANWGKLLEETEDNHWRKIYVAIQFYNKLMAGKPAQLNAANAMIKARGLQDVLDAKLEEVTDPVEREALAKNVEDEGLCEFHRRPGKPGLWLPSNNIKAMIKENWSILGYRNSIRGSRGALAEGLFVISPDNEDPSENDWIFLGPEDILPDEPYVNVSHTIGPKGPVSAIKRHEYVERVKFTFEIQVAWNVVDKIPDQKLADTLVHGKFHGLGACRSQGFGTHNILKMWEPAVAKDGREFNLAEAEKASEERRAHGA